MLKTVLGAMKTTVGGWMGAVAGVARFGLKPIKYFIDSHFRPKVVPVPGSVLYCDLWVAVEHSGIYVADGQIANITVTGVAQSQVKYSDGADFTDKSTLGRKIYVSCRGRHAVGDEDVAGHAASRIGDEGFYGLVIKNCHQFSSQCVRQAWRHTAYSLPQRVIHNVSDWFDPQWEFTIRQLKADARDKLGADKWLLWDWNGQAAQQAEPDWQAHEDFFKSQPLTPEFVQLLQQELAATQDYEAELADEDIPPAVRQQLRGFGQTLAAVAAEYERVKPLLQACPGAAWSYQDIQACGADFVALAKQLQSNTAVQALAAKMGRNHITEEVKRQQRVPQADQSEVYGIYRSSDLLRLLPSELANLEDETLETLFYARLLENQLLTYELRGQGWMTEEYSENQARRGGPVVACLDTSGSMQGQPLLKAKALLFAIANMLQQEQRSLHVLLFGAQGELKEYTLDSAADLPGLLHFLQQGFGGGTDFEAPLSKALELIRQQQNYQKADILMISDGDCSLPDGFSRSFRQQAEDLNCRVYSVLCAGERVADSFSDEVAVL